MIIGLVVYRLTLQPVGNIHGGAKKWGHKLMTIILSNLNRGRLKMHDLKMQDWKMTDKILANCGQNYGVWKMQDLKMTDHVN